MPYRMSWVDWVLLPVALVGGAGLVYAAFHVLGFLGIGTLGLLIGLVAVNVDLERGGPVGSVQAHLYSAFARSRERMSGDEKAEFRASLARDRMPLFVAKVVSAGMVVLGFGLFFLVQLPG